MPCYECKQCILTLNLYSFIFSSHIAYQSSHLEINKFLKTSRDKINKESPKINKIHNFTYQQSSTSVNKLPISQLTNHTYNYQNSHILPNQQQNY